MNKDDVAGLSEAMVGLLKDLPDNGLEAASFWNRDKRLRTYRALAKRGLADSFGAITNRGRKVLERSNDTD